jgi:predicted ATPase
MRHARPVGASPLLDLAVVRGKTDRELALYELLADVIQERWTLERRTMGLPADVTGSVSDGTALLQDFGANSVDLESWSVIFHRYLAGGGLAVGRIAEIIGEGWPHARRLVYRRHERGLQLLTDALVTREAIAPFGVPRLAPGNLPRRRSSFVGREESVVEVARLVSRERLLTLVGSPGVGKTRLALETALTLGDGFEDGTWLVEFAPLTSDTLVAPAVADVLGVLERPDEPPLVALSAALRRARLVVVLDNCEHVLPAVRHLAETIMNDCAGVHLLATSRVPLRVRREVVWRVSGLAVPEAGTGHGSELAEVASVRLFVDRAKALDSRFVLDSAGSSSMAALCRQLGGIPLAIELAAARTDVLTVPELVAKMDDALDLLTRGYRNVDRRQQTLRSSIEWSYALLNQDERRFLRALSVFRGSWSADAALAVFGCGETAAVGSLLDRLLDNSLVEVRGEPSGSRYGLLESVRQFAQEELASSDEAESTTRRHEAWCLSLAEEARSRLEGPEAVHWQARLDADHDNLRAAFDSALEHDPETALLLGVALWQYWDIRSQHTEGIDRLDRALAAGTRDDVLRARALTAAGTLALFLGRFRDATQRLDDALQASRRTGDPRILAAAVAPAALCAVMRGELEHAQALCDEGLQLAKDLDDQRLRLSALMSTVNVAILTGRIQDGWRAAREALELAQRFVDKRSESRILASQGTLAWFDGELFEADTFITAARDLADALGDHITCHHTRWLLALIALVQGRLEDANELLTDVLRRTQISRDQYGLPFVLESMALTWALQARPLHAAKLFGAAEALREVMGSPMPLPSRPMLDEALTAMRAATREAEIRSAWRAGRTLTSSNAVRFALGELGA